MVGSSYWFSDKLAVKMARAVEVEEHQLPQYHAIMRELSQLASIPMPRLYVSPEPQPNAFATGRNPHHAAVCVTEGLLRTLNWDEIRGVLAHEIMHVRNRDILTSSIAAGLATVISYAANIAMWTTMFGGGRDRQGGHPLAGLLAIIVAPLAAGLIQMGISRSREFEADRSAARMLGDGESLARALEKLHGYSLQVPSRVPEAQASMYIVNPLAGRRGQSSMANLFSTHPDAAERIRRLRAGEWRSLV
jgi:heat shock protein HtpX